MNTEAPEDSDHGAGESKKLAELQAEIRLQVGRLSSVGDEQVNAFLDSVAVAIVRHQRLLGIHEQWDTAGFGSARLARLRSLEKVAERALHGLARDWVIGQALPRRIPFDRQGAHLLAKAVLEGVYGREDPEIPRGAVDPPSAATRFTRAFDDAQRALLNLHLQTQSQIAEAEAAPRTKPKAGESGVLAYISTEYQRLLRVKPTETRTSPFYIICASVLKFLGEKDEFPDRQVKAALKGATIPPQK